MAGPVGTEYKLDLQEYPGAWSHVLSTEAWEAVAEGLGGRPSGLVTPC